MIFKNLPSWAKGGIILTVTDVLFWMLSFIWASRPGGSDIAPLAVLGVLYYGILSVIPAFGIGALIGSVVGSIAKSKESNSLKGMKIGFSISLIIILTYIAIFELFYLFSIGFFNIDPAPATIVIPLILIALGSLIGWLVGNFKLQNPPVSARVGF